MNRRTSQFGQSRRIFTAFLLTAAFTIASLEARANTHYVNVNGLTPVWPFATPGTAATTIQEALDAAADGDTVLVSDGVYLVTAPVIVGKAVHLASVNGTATTIIDGNSATTCLNESNSGAVVEAFTIRNGVAPSAPGFPTTGPAAGGVLLTGGTLLNCVVTGNFCANHWADANVGGVWCGAATVAHCTISGNSAYAFPNAGPGGVWADQGALIQDCEITQNHGKDTYGGGAVCAGNAVIERCILTGNDAGLSGGGVYCTGGIVRNCVIANNVSLGSYVGGRGAVLS